MGNKFCCSGPNPKLAESSPFFTQNRFTVLKKEQRQLEMLEALRSSTAMSNMSYYGQGAGNESLLHQKKKKLKEKCKLKFIEAFSVSIGTDSPVRFLSFSQRKYVGFRNQYEYDRKRLLIASDTAFCIIGYDIDEKPQELINTCVSDNEIIQYIGFLDDEKPQFVLLITRHTKKPKTIVRMLKIKKENDRSFSAVMNDIENQRQIEELVRGKVAKGEAREPRSIFDNYNLYLDSDLDQFKKENIQPYHRDISSIMNNQLQNEAAANLLRNSMDEDNNQQWTLTDKNNMILTQTNQQQSTTQNTNNLFLNADGDLNGLDDDIDFEPEQAKIEMCLQDANDTQASANNLAGVTTTQDPMKLKLPPNVDSLDSSFCDFPNQVAQENNHERFKTQVVPENFIAYHIYEIQEQTIQHNEICGGQGFKHINYFNYSQFKKLVFCFSPETIFYSYLINHRLHSNVSQNNSFAGGNGNKSQNNISKSFTSTKDPILINTHHTQYYGRIFNNNYQYKKIQFEGKIKHMDFAYEKIYVIYEEQNTFLDVLQVNGILNQRFQIDDCFLEHGLELLRLTFVQVPLLKWSTRQINLQGFGGGNGGGIGNPSDILKKIVITGQVMYQLQKRNFIMIFNLETNQAEIIKIIDIDAEITCVNYGPYDNGHILVGLDDGKLIAFDYLTLERLETVKIFDGQAINCITFDPTNYIFVGGQNGRMICLSYIDKKMHYLYLDLGKNKFCTVQLPRNYTPDIQNNRIGYNHLEGSSNFCCV